MVMTNDIFQQWPVTYCRCLLRRVLFHMDEASSPSDLAYFVDETFLVCS